MRKGMSNLDYIGATVVCSQKLMPCSENSRKFNFNNPKQIPAKLYKVDGGLIASVGQKKCDYMYEVFSPDINIAQITKDLNQDNKISPHIKKLVYVELKGKDFEQGVSQLEVTAATFKKRHSSCKSKHGFIVCSKVRHPQFSTLYQNLKAKFRKNHNISLTIQSQVSNMTI